MAQLRSTESLCEHLLCKIYLPKADLPDSCGIQQVKQDRIRIGWHDRILQDGINHNEPTEVEGLKRQGGLELAVTQGADKA
jgi:hypothetical protein